MHRARAEQTPSLGFGGWQRQMFWSVAMEIATPPPPTVGSNDSNETEHLRFENAIALL